MSAEQEPAPQTEAERLTLEEALRRVLPEDVTVTKDDKGLEVTANDEELEATAAEPDPQA